MSKRPCKVKLGDIVRHREYDDFYGIVTYIESIPDTPDYYVEVAGSEDVDALYFFDDELFALKIVKE